jgi:hypothetical protein
VVLFGSHARGDADSRSDLDLLLVFDTGEDVKRAEGELLDLLEEFHSLPLVFSRRSGDELVADPSFFFNVFREGYVLYKRPGTELLPAAIAREKQSIIYSYELTSLSHGQKLKFHSALSSRVIKKKYRYPGLLERVHGEKLGGGVILVPANAEREIDALFEEYGISFKKRYVWEMERLYR